MRDLVVLGAGLGGSGLAKVMADLGWDVLLIEKGNFPRHKVCGEFLSPEAQASLRALGLYGAVREMEPCPMRSVRLVSVGGISVTVPMPEPAWGISRFALDLALLDAARGAGVELWTGMTASSVHQEDDGYRVQLKGDQAVRARAVVGAWGRQPMAGLRSEQPKAPRRRTFVGVKCHLEGVEMEPRVELGLFDGGYAGMAPVPGERVNFSGLLSKEAFSRAGGTVEGALEAVRRWNPALGAHLGSARVVDGTEVVISGVNTSETPVPWGLVPQIGDSAAVIPPLCGDGMAMALRSAEILAPLAHEYLGGRLTLARWRHAYTQAWHREFDAVLRTGRNLQAILMFRRFSDVLLTVGRGFPVLTEYLLGATRGRHRPLDDVQEIARALGGQR